MIKLLTNWVMFKDSCTVYRSSDLQLKSQYMKTVHIFQYEAVYISKVAYRISDAILKYLKSDWTFGWNIIRRNCKFLILRLWSSENFNPCFYRLCGRGKLSLDMSQVRFEPITTNFESKWYYHSAMLTHEILGYLHVWSIRKPLYFDVIKLILYIIVVLF